MIRSRAGCRTPTGSPDAEPLYPSDQLREMVRLQLQEPRPILAGGASVVIRAGFLPAALTPHTQP
jgi:hypothetical protein